MAWIPCSGHESASGLVWLPRLLEKARHCAASDGRLADGYCYGDNDFIDKQLIAFLRTDDVTVSALVKQHPADEEVARILVERSGRSTAECSAFSTAFRRRNFDFVFVDADEGRLRPGFKSTTLKLLYNSLMMPIFYRLFQRDERNRSARGHAP
jgi:hypothetical protein